MLLYHFTYTKSSSCYDYYPLSKQFHTTLQVSPWHTYHTTSVSQLLNWSEQDVESMALAKIKYYVPLLMFTLLAASTSTRLNWLWQLIWMYL